jgi:hypothetical protein
MTPSLIISSKGERPPELDIALATPSSPLPEWLTAHNPHICPTVLPRFPVSREQLELEQSTFDTIFESVLDEVICGNSVTGYLNRYPIKVNYGRFQKWIRNLGQVNLTLHMRILN